MEIQEFLKYRIDLLDEAKDDLGSINETNFINTVIPSMLDAKLIDSEDFTETYYPAIIDGVPIKINGYMINDSGERLQLFILNEESISLDSRDLEITHKEYYDSIFKKAFNFVKLAINKNLKDLQNVGAINALINHLSSPLGAEQFDVIEMFLISATATTENRGQTPQPKRIDFKDESIQISYPKNNIEKKGPPIQVKKEVLILKRLIDLNFLYNVLISQGNREVLKIDFDEQFEHKIEAIIAADEENFESYLCVIPANILAELYKRYSSRLLEKNVRSFLQFKGANQGIKKTLIKEPEKFIAYNNGLTVTASGKTLEIIDKKIYLKSLIDFQIVNGGQTTASIYFSQKEGIDISKVKVMAKINVAKNISEAELNDLILNISDFSNAQTRVSPVDRSSNSPLLVKIKALSESIVTPSGRKWFFEKSKGEFNTKLRIAGQSGKNRIEKEYPKEFRFTKEQLGKFYSSWGDEPYRVKKGGEAIFRKFLEDISKAETEKKLSIDRNFYELMISKIILFKSLEEIHGTRNNAIGQLRSAVVPYTISILYSKTEGDKKNPNTFDLVKLWSKEGLEDDLKVYLKELMILVNDLIKKYAKSDDLGEYSKKQELWEAIYSSEELKHFLNSENSTKIFSKYSISKKELEKRLKVKSKEKEIDFEIVNNQIQIFTKTELFYKKIESLLWEMLSANEKNKLSKIIACIQQKSEISLDLIAFEKQLLQKIRVDYPIILNDLDFDEDLTLSKSLQYIIEKYNACREKDDSIESKFKEISEIARQKGIKYDSIFTEISKGLINGEQPRIKQLYYASFYIKSFD